MQKISLKDYLRRKEALRVAQKTYALKCTTCKKAIKTCFCSKIKKVDSKIKFVILIHQEELRRSVATGRMTHLSLTGSRLFRGSVFTHHHELNEILKDQNNYCVLLYPGKKSIPLETLKNKTPKGKQLVCIVLDATWHEARRMYRFSPNLHSLPMVSFVPQKPSQFQVRTQPSENCYSTIETVHHVLSVLEPEQNYDGMLEVFHFLVETQLHFERTGPGR